MSGIGWNMIYCGVTYVTLAAVLECTVALAMSARVRLVISLLLCFDFAVVTVSILKQMSASH